MAHYFPAPAVLGPSGYCSNEDALAKVIQKTSQLVSPQLMSALDHTGRTPASGDVKYIFLTKSGPGPIRQPFEESLLDPHTGLAKAPSNKHKRLQISAPNSQGKGNGSSGNTNSSSAAYSTVSYLGTAVVGAAVGGMIAFAFLKK